MEKKLEDTGLGKALYMMSVFKNVTTEANLCQTNATLDVENQHKDGKGKIIINCKKESPYALFFILLIAAQLQPHRLFR